jgi:calcineurin-binding protein cabin-1
MKALDVDGRDVVVWYHMALVCINVGRMQLARFALEQGLKCSPDHWLSIDKLAEVCTFISFFFFLFFLFVYI